MGIDLKASFLLFYFLKKKKTPIVLVLFRILFLLACKQISHHIKVGHWMVVDGTFECLGEKNVMGQVMEL
jgi:hypothetical protein